MDLRKILDYSESYLLPIIFLAQALNSSLSSWSAEGYSFLFALNDIIRPLTFAFLLFFSSRNVSKHIDAKVFAGIFLSYTPFFFLKFSPVLNNEFIGISAFILNLFYLLVMFGGVYQIRRQFTVLPGFKTLKSSGLYSVVRHPIYASYLHLALIHLLINWSYINLFLICCIFLGINLRATSEEKVILANNVSYMKVMPRFRYFHWVLTTPLLLLFIYNFTLQTIEKKVISVHLAYPIYSLNPHQADDWSSFFVMNHIYPRFNSRIGEYRSNTIFEAKEVVCSESQIPVFSQECKTVKVLYKVKDHLKTCNQQAFSASDFELELSEILKLKNWIFPNFKFCGPGCFEFSNVANIQERFDSIYLRFGWSKTNPKNTSFGILPNCFNVKKSDGNIISEGELKTNSSYVLLSQEENSNYDIVLYGNKPEGSVYQSLNFFNPIYLYLLTSKSLDKESIESIQEVLFINKIINHKSHLTQEAINSSLTFGEVKLPDYLDGCNKLSGELKRATKNLEFSCTNISVFTEETVKKGQNWDGFISPLTPGMPGRKGIQEQYFNPSSKDNWLGPRPQATNVVLLGTKSGVMQVKKGKFCSIKPNSLGLSDVTIDDFIECK